MESARGFAFMTNGAEVVSAAGGVALWLELWHCGTVALHFATPPCCLAKEFHHGTKTMHPQHTSNYHGHRLDETSNQHSMN